MAHRIDSYNKAVVFTDQPIPQGSMFQVKLMDKGGGWAGSIVSPIIPGPVVINFFKYSPLIHIEEIWVYQRLTR